MVDIKESLRRLLQLHTEIKEEAKTLNAKRKEEKELKSLVAVYMKEKNQDIIDVGSHKINYKSTKLSASLSKDFLQEKVSAFLKKKKVKNDFSSEFIEYLWQEKKECGKVSERITIKALKRKASEIENDLPEANLVTAINVESDNNENKNDNISIELVA